MTLSDASLAELMAELRKRLRPFMSNRNDVKGPAGARPSCDLEDLPDPLGPAGRASLSARLLAVVLVHRKDPGSAEIAQAFENLAEMLDAASAPLPGSELENGLVRLAEEFEDLAMTWDRNAGQDLRGAWCSLRAVGDRIWSPCAPSASMAVCPDDKSMEEDPQDQELLLLVSGRMRRDMLRHRLESAGWSVVCPADGAMAVTMLSKRRPAALICDDAAPERHGRCLRRLLPAEAPPVIWVRRGVADRGPRRKELVWLPPYRATDLPAGPTRMIHEGPTAEG
jgi:hypothetical protein